ncbi:MAG: nucleotidyl transferase AbiEii/AbiGii toxin family protein [bacterium]
MRISREHLFADAASSGFRPEILEKVIHLIGLLEGFKKHPFLNGKLALKGGTALNLFIFDLPRLSIDIDLNYIGSENREVMLDERTKIDDAIRSVCHREGYIIQKSPDEHAGGKWQLRYDSAMGQGGNLALDINYLLRVPLWNPNLVDSHVISSYQAKQILILDKHELAAGKLAALLARHTARDLFDTHQLFTNLSLNNTQLRLAFVVYGGFNRIDWRTVSINDISFKSREIENQLFPVLIGNDITSIKNIDVWAQQLINECKEGLRSVLPLQTNEIEFLNRLLDSGDIKPELLTEDISLIHRISSHPGLLWKAQNVKEHKNL